MLRKNIEKNAKIEDFGLPNPSQTPLKMVIFLDLVFGGILIGVWEGLGRPKTSIFAFFSMFFRSKF